MSSETLAAMEAIVGGTSAKSDDEVARIADAMEYVATENNYWANRIKGLKSMLFVKYSGADMEEMTQGMHKGPRMGE